MIYILLEDVRVEAKIGVRVRVQKTVDVGVLVLLSLVKAPTSSFLLVGKEFKQRLQYVCGLVILIG